MQDASPIFQRHGALGVYLHAIDEDLALNAIIDRMAPHQPVVWLDSARVHPVTGRWSLLGLHPWLRLQAKAGRLSWQTSALTREFQGNPFAALGEALRRYHIPQSGQAHQRAIGLMGFLSYDANRWIERLPPPQDAMSGQPDMLMLGMSVVVLVDHIERRSWIVSVADPHAAPALARRQASARLEEMLERVDQSRSAHTAPLKRFTAAAPLPTIPQAEFERQANRVLEHIRSGDIYQANLSQRFTASFSGDPRRLYRELRRINPSPFASYLSDGELAVASCSPERLLRSQDGRLDSRPIAGTRPRGSNAWEDTVNSLELFLSEKERAEHIMLVDLMRNDLGRVCRHGSVQVVDLMALESYSHVHHIVSDVSGRLRPGVGALEAICAVFPGGTITGCPKVRCMEILRSLEPVARGLYTGSLGYIGFDGTFDLNIAIRTIILQGKRLSLHAGAGIVADSDPSREYHETLAKAQALMAAIAQSSGARVHADAAAG
jgi:aminodeoxychorismate synthase component I